MSIAVVTTSPMSTSVSSLGTNTAGLTKFKVVEFYRNNNRALSARNLASSSSLNNGTTSDYSSGLYDVLGFEIIGGYLSDVPATIVNVAERKDLKVEEGDIIWEINGINTRNLTLNEDPEYKKRFKERLKDLHMQQQQPQQQQQNGIKKPLINGTTSTTAVNGSSLMRTAVSKSCDNHINETTPGSPAGQNGNSNGNGNSSPNNQANCEMLSNSLNTLLNGGGDDFDDESSDYMNGGSNAHIYDNNGILTPDENGHLTTSITTTTTTTTTATTVAGNSPTTGNTLSGLIGAFQIEIDESIKRRIDEKLRECSSGDSDSDSEHQIYTPKAVDLPSAQRLAKRLYYLDGFKLNDVVRHLSKNQLVADEYLKLFNFESLTLDAALRKFLKQFQLTGDAQEKERVLMYFAKRYVDQNITAFNDVDSCHTLTCALMLLNTDLHDPKIQNKMTLNEFIENLKGLNNGSNFPEVLLESLYSAIKNEPLECAYIENDEFGTGGYDERNTAGAGSGGAHGNAAFSLRSNNNPFFQMPDPQTAKEYKSGWLLRKCCFDADGKKSAFLKRSWKIFYASLRDMVLYLHKDDKVLKNNTFDNITNAIRIHHALATVASDYKKKQFVFRLKTADWAEYLFQTSNSNELYDWVSCINLVAAMFSSPPLPSAIGSAKTFQRPLMPVSKTRYTLAEQCEYHRKHLKQLHADMARLGVLVADANASIMPSSAAAAANHTGATNGSNGHVVHFPNGHANTATNHAFDKDKYNYYQFEIQRYTTYINLLEEQLSNEQQIQLQQQQSAQHHQQHINHMATTIMPQINIINPAQETTILGTSTSSSNSSSTSHYMTSAAHRNGSLCNSSISTSTTTPKTTVILNDASPTKSSMPSTPLHHLTSSSAQAYHNRTPNSMLYKTGSDIMPPISISTGGASSVSHLHQIMPTTPTTINSKKLVSSYVD